MFSENSSRDGGGERRRGLHHVVCERVQCPATVTGDNAVFVSSGVC